MLIWIIISILIVSITPPIVLFFHNRITNRNSSWFLYSLSFATGDLLGQTFFRLIPKIIKYDSHKIHFAIAIASAIVLLGILFALEKYQKDRKWLADIPLFFALALHNTIDGAAIAGAFILRLHLGLTTVFYVLMRKMYREFQEMTIAKFQNKDMKKEIIILMITALALPLGALATLYAHQFEIEGQPFLLSYTAVAIFYYSVHVIHSLFTNLTLTKKQKSIAWLTMAIGLITGRLL